MSNTNKASQNTESQEIVGANFIKLLFDSFALYEPPFTYDSTYIFDSKRNMVMNVNKMQESELVLRGWGRIRGMENAEALHDAVGAHIAMALTEYWEKGLIR